MKNKFFMILSILWTIVAIVSGLYAVINGGALYGEEMTDPSVSYILASFGVPGIISIIFGFCNSVEDIVKFKNTAKEIAAEIKK